MQQAVAPCTCIEIAYQIVYIHVRKILHTILSCASAHGRLSFVPEFAVDGRLLGRVDAYNVITKEVGVVIRLCEGTLR